MALFGTPFKEKELVARVVRRFRQELMGENCENLDRIVSEHREALARILWKENQSSCKWSEDGPVLLPDRCRLYYRKEQTEVMLFEHPPQVRLIRFAEQKNQEPKIYTLGFPYIIFLFKFHNGVFSDLRCAFSDVPLKSLEEQVLFPYLTNVFDDLKVCMGVHELQFVKGDLTQQVTVVMDYFWQSVFNSEAPTYYVDYKKHFQEHDKRLTSFEEWEKATEIDPLFVIDNVKWMQCELNFGDLIVDSLSKADLTLQSKLFEDICDEMLNDVNQNVKESVEKVAKQILDMSPSLI